MKMLFSIPLPAMFAEATGTFFFLLAIVLSGPAHTVLAPLAIGLSLFVSVGMMAGSSGGHINPAVTVGVYLAARNKFRLLDVFWYIISQIGGGVLGALLGRSLAGYAIYGFDLESSTAQKIGAEMAFSTLLVLSVLCVVFGGSSKELGALLIGTTVTVGAITAGPVSGCGVNPAASLSVMIVTSEFSDFPIYFLSPFLGSIISAGIFRFAYCHVYDNGQLYDFIMHFPFKVKEPRELSVIANVSVAKVDTEKPGQASFLLT